jgi:hypothetical protein
MPMAAKILEVCKMALEVTISGKMTITGESNDEEISDSFVTTTTPTITVHQYKTLTTTNTKETLNIGSITTVHYIWIRSISKDMYIDPSYTSSTFRNGLTLHEGEIAMFKPTGAVWVINKTASESPIYEYIAVGV